LNGTSRISSDFIRTIPAKKIDLRGEVLLQSLDSETRPTW
jgi:hypothetical protein